MLTVTGAWAVVTGADELRMELPLVIHQRPLIPGKHHERIVLRRV